LKYNKVVAYVNEILAQYPMKLTLRQIYYRLVANYDYPNTKSAYTQLSKQLVKARNRRDIDETRIEDRSREFLGGEDYAFETVKEFIEYQTAMFLDSPRHYSRKIWTTQPEFIIIWVEKDALSRVIHSVANRFNVITAPSRGYASFTYIKEAIEKLPLDKDIIILHFADHDPSGLDMTRDLETRFKEYLPNEFKGTLQVERVALNYDQVRYYNLPPNPTKSADPRSINYIRHFGNECWELDAIEPGELQSIVNNAIVRHIDDDIWNETLEQERQDKEKLRVIFGILRRKLEEINY